MYAIIDRFEAECDNPVAEVKLPTQTGGMKVL